MEKDKSIRNLVEELKLDQNGWIIVDHWEGDLCAIGIARPQTPRRLVWISTFNKMPGYYDYECEIPAGLEDYEYLSVKEGRDVSFEELLDVLKAHLNGCQAH